MANGKIETYPEAARAIHVWLIDFCDENRTYPDMIAEAARRADRRIKELEAEVERLKKCLENRN